MDFGNRTNGIRTDQFDHPPIVVLGVHVDAHLRLHPGDGGSSGNEPAFVDVAGERFFAEDVFLFEKGGEGGEGVGVFGDRNHHAVDVVDAGIVEFAKVGEGSGFWVTFLGGCKVLGIDITNGGDVVLPGHLFSIVDTAPSNADAGKVQSGVG